MAVQLPAAGPDGLLAVFSVWLVKELPDSEAPQQALPARSTPDYEMRGFELQRFGADGRPQAWLRGEALRHYPDDDRVEFDRIRLELQGADGSWLQAESQQAVGPQDGSRLRMSGTVLVRRYAPGRRPGTRRARAGAADHRAARRTRRPRLSSRAMTQVLTPSAKAQVAGFRYEHAGGRLDFDGPSRFEFLAPGKRAKR